MLIYAQTIQLSLMGRLISILIRIKFSYAVSEDQPPQSMASDLGMHPVPIFYLHSFQL